MQRIGSFVVCSVLLLLCVPEVVADPRSALRKKSVKDLQIAVPGDGVVLHSATNTNALRFKEAAGPGTFALYGYVDGIRVAGDGQCANPAAARLA